MGPFSKFLRNVSKRADNDLVSGKYDGQPLGLDSIDVATDIQRPPAQGEAANPSPASKTPGEQTAKGG